MMNFGNNNNNNNNMMTMGMAQQFHHPQQQQVMMNANMNQFNHQQHQMPVPNCGLPALQASCLGPDMLELIQELFTQDADLELAYIELPSIRLLEEISHLEQKAAVREFVERFKKAKHKIKKSRPGYFRGVCQKYWKQNRERKKCELLRRANMQNPMAQCDENNNNGQQHNGGNNKYYRHNHRGPHARISPIIAEAIELLFTPASGLETSIIDESIERRLTQLSDQQGIQALYEFCSAVMYRQERIRNLNAYLMNIISRQMDKTGSRNGHNRNNRRNYQQNNGNNRYKQQQQHYRYNNNGNNMNNMNMNNGQMPMGQQQQQQMQFQAQNQFNPQQQQQQQGMMMNHNGMNNQFNNNNMNNGWNNNQNQQFMHSQQQQSQPQQQQFGNNGYMNAMNSLSPTAQMNMSNMQNMNGSMPISAYYNPNNVMYNNTNSSMNNPMPAPGASIPFPSQCQSQGMNMNMLNSPTRQQQQQQYANNNFVSFPMQQPNSQSIGVHGHNHPQHSNSNQSSHSIATNKKIQELSQLVDGVGSESTESESESMNNSHSINKQRKTPSFAATNNRKSIVYNKEHHQTPKFNATRQSRKCSNDHNDFAIDEEEEQTLSMNHHNKNGQNKSQIADSSEDDDDAGLVLLEEDEDDSEEDKERGLTKFGPMIDDSESDDDEEDNVENNNNAAQSGNSNEADDEEDEEVAEGVEEGEDEFLFANDESDDSEILPKVEANHKSALFDQFYSASDGYAFYETQKTQSLKSRNNRFFNQNRHFKNNLNQIGATKRDKKDDIFEIIREKKKKDKEIKTKRIIKILKDLSKEGRIKHVLNGGDVKSDSFNVGNADDFNEEELEELTLIANKSLIQPKNDNEKSAKPTLLNSKSMNNGPYSSPFASGNSSSFYSTRPLDNVVEENKGYDYNKLEGLADSGPNCDMDHMQDSLRLRQMMRRGNKKSHISTSETKKSAMDNRRKLMMRQYKIDASEDKMLTNSLFRETAKLLKHDSDKRKKQQKDATESSPLSKKPSLKHYHSDGYQPDEVEESVAALSVDTSVTHTSTSNALLKYLGAMEPKKEERINPLTPGNHNKEKSLMIGIKKPHLLHIDTTTHKTPDQSMRKKKKEHAFSRAFTPQSVGFNASSYPNLKRPNIDPYAQSNPIKDLDKKIEIFADENELSPLSQQEDDNDHEIKKQYQRQKLTDSYSYNVFCIGDEDRKKKPVSAEKVAKIDKIKQEIKKKQQKKEKESIAVDMQIENEWVCSDYDGQSSVDVDMSMSHPKLCKYKDEETTTTTIATESVSKSKNKPKSVNEAAMNIMAMARGLHSDDEEEESSENEEKSEQNENDNENNEEEIVKVTESPGVNVNIAPKLKDRSSTKIEPKLMDRSSTRIEPRLLNRQSVKISKNHNMTSSEDDDGVSDLSSTKMDHSVPKMSASRNSNQVPIAVPKKVLKQAKKKLMRRQRRKDRQRQLKNAQNSHQQQFGNNNNNGNGANYNQYQQQQQNLMMQQQQRQQQQQQQQSSFYNNNNQYAQRQNLSSMNVPYLSSVPNANNGNNTGVNAANAQQTNNPNNNKQLKQLENTVEQLRSHFVQLLQHLPLTTSQQQQLHHSNANSVSVQATQSAMNQMLASNPNTVNVNVSKAANNANSNTSMPNVASLTNVLSQNSVTGMNSLRSMIGSPMAPTPTTATNYQTPTSRAQPTPAYTFPASLSSMPLPTNPMINPFTNPSTTPNQNRLNAAAANSYLLQNLQSPTNLNAAALYQNNSQQQNNQNNNFNIYNNHQ